MLRATEEPRLTDIVEAIEVIRSETAGLSLETFANSKVKRWIVERGIEIISEASRHLSPELKLRHPDIPWGKIAGIGNVIRHDYEHIDPDILWGVVVNRLAPLELACRLELIRERQDPNGS